MKERRAKWRSSEVLHPALNYEVCEGLRTISTCRFHLAALSLAAGSLTFRVQNAPKTMFSQKGEHTNAILIPSHTQIGNHGKVPRWKERPAADGPHQIFSMSACVCAGTAPPQQFASI